jgi:hypothetical protein
MGFPIFLRTCVGVRTTSGKSLPSREGGEADLIGVSLRNSASAIDKRCSTIDTKSWTNRTVWPTFPHMAARALDFPRSSQIERL